MAFSDTGTGATLAALGPKIENAPGRAGGASLADSSGSQASLADRSSLVSFNRRAPTVDQTIATLNVLGVIVFAVSGALAAAQRRMDPFGLVVLATVTGLGGGTLRDLFLGVRPVRWVDRPGLVLLCAATGVAVYLLVPRLPMTRLSAYTRALNWADAAGLALFAVTGTQQALEQDVAPATAVALGMLTAIGGGILRDLLAGIPPLVLHREIYALAALLGGAAFWVLERTGLTPSLALILAALLAFTVRVLGFTRRWSLPAYGGDG